eukprot:TRINITY_DN14269_c0_g2_i1.p1 TRINITY_DN14269_c0_g2~~TRINITY_DN14269_c0_g2_i1.p1  ORF type:complete len:147 (-),score=19.93 TRINITY_DN14269_c0_g2_i1:12-386(-)
MAPPPKQVLMQAAIGDALVTTLGAAVMARAYNASLIAPPAREVWGIPVRQPPFVGNAFTEWKYGNAPPGPLGDLPAQVSTDTHECVRRESLAQDQIGLFVQDGIIRPACYGQVCEVRCSCATEY